MNRFAGNIEGKVFAMWGLSFKPKTDDMREAPSLVIIEKLLAKGAKVVAYDPVAMHEAKHTLGDTVAFADNEYDTLKGADALLIITEWPEFRSPDFKQMGALLNNKLIFDGRNIYDLAEMNENGFEYYCIGVKTV
jgi:UDPglucose 6-dehydrogenase